MGEVGRDPLTEQLRLFSIHLRIGMPFLLSLFEPKHDPVKCRVTPVTFGAQDRFFQCLSEEEAELMVAHDDCWVLQCIGIDVDSVINLGKQCLHTANESQQQAANLKQVLHCRSHLFRALRTFEDRVRRRQRSFEICHR